MLISTDLCGWAFDIIANGLKKYIDPHIEITGRNYSKPTKVFQLGSSVPPYPDVTTNLFASFSNTDIVIPCKHAVAINPLVKRAMLPLYRPYLVRQCVDHEYFTKTRVKSDRFRVGWVGNANRDIKRYHLYEWVKSLLPFDFRRCIQLPSLTGEIAYDKLQDFYCDLDLLLCTSHYDAGPGCCFEAALCKVPTLLCSNMVGFAALGEPGYDYFQCEPQNLPYMITYLANNRELIDIVGENAHNLVLSNYIFPVNKENWNFVLNL